MCKIISACDTTGLKIRKPVNTRLAPSITSFRSCVASFIKKCLYLVQGGVYCLFMTHEYE